MNEDGLLPAEAATSLLVVELLQAAPVGHDLTSHPSAPELAELLCRFLPEVLAYKYRDWRYESLDAIHFRLIKKTRDHEFFVCGTCILITDQSVVPVCATLCVAPPRPGFARTQCQLGELDSSGQMIREGYNSARALKLYAELESRIESLPWAYHCELVDESSPA